MKTEAGFLDATWPAWPLGGAADDLLWGATGGESFRAARENSARVLRTLRAMLDADARSSAAARDFVALGEWLDADPAARDRVWADPRAYAWTRAAHELARTGPPAALARHLHQFKAFALGAAWLGGRDCVFEAPLTAATPFALPGTRLSVDGPPLVEIAGLVGGRLCLGAAGTLPLDGRGTVTPDGLALHECPLARVDGYAVPLHPHAFSVPGLAVGEPAVRAGLAYHARHADLVERTLHLIRSHAPESFEAFRRVIRLIGLKPLAWGGFDDFSPAEMPGAFVASVIHNPFVLADHFIHELQHNRLQLVEESGPLFEPGAGEEARYYSPWRDKPRGLYGIFHGAYVFLGVGRFWRTVYAAHDVGVRDRAYALDRLLRLPVQLDLALAVLHRHARLTALGRSLLVEITADVARLHRAVAGWGLPADSPALTVGEDGVYVAETSEAGGRPLTVRAALREHLRRNEAHAHGATLPLDWAT
jgi:HEXXH motif-containing protein